MGPRGDMVWGMEACIQGHEKRASRAGVAAWGLWVRVGHPQEMPSRPWTQGKAPEELRMQDHNLEMVARSGWG